MINMLNIILFGPPGSGKGTQAELLAKHYGLYHISTGDLFRSEMQQETSLGLEARSYMARGVLVPDSVTIGMLRNAVDAHSGVTGFVFDGFPRTIAQAEALEALLRERNTDITGLVALDVPDDEIIDRILLRGKTSGRPDDNDASVIRNRIQVYRDETAPIFGHFEGRAQTVDGVGTIEDIFARLCSAIDRLYARSFFEEE